MVNLIISNSYNHFNIINSLTNSIFKAMQIMNNIYIYFYWKKKKKKKKKIVIKNKIN